MGSITHRKWVAVDDDLIVEEAASRESLEIKLRERGMDPENYDVTTVPKVWRGIWL